MAKLMSFWLTREQFIAQLKDVTRRLGWVFLKPGDLVWGCEKCQGLPKGSSVVKLGLIRIVDVRREPLNAITPEDVKREGFPDLTPPEFVEFFCKHMGVTPETIVTRIEFEYVRQAFTLPIARQLNLFDFAEVG